nr:MAG TPA: hypothetical protein [Caudoviricetes sp.]
MTENNQIDINLENKKTDDIYTAIHEILKNAHRIAKVQIAAKEVTDTIKNYEREKAIVLIAQYINKYKNILNFLSKFTGRYIIYEPNFYNDKSDDIILCDLKYIRNVIYADEIKNAGLEYTLEKALKKLNLVP